MSKSHLTFEIFGKVQGVSFRQYCCDRARSLHLVGCVSNSNDGTVVGEAIGERDQIHSFRQWLTLEGSPACRIDRTAFNEQTLNKTQEDNIKHKYTDFHIIKH